MEEMMKAITRAANAVAGYYEKEAANPVKAAQRAAAPLTEQIAPETRVEAERKERKPRAPKEPKAETAPVPQAPEAAAPAPAAMTEQQSEEKLKVVGEAFVQRFSKSGDAVEEVKTLLTTRFKVARLRDLVHAQRVEMIAHLEGRIKEIDGKQTVTQAGVAPAAPAGLGL